jgi:solute carrier family 41
MVFAGLVLNSVQHWPVFKAFPELFILVPALLGLKGNLEMTLASRLSTSANLGHLSDWSKAKNAAVANLALVQLQGIVVGGVAAVIPIAGSYFSQNK